MRRRQMVKIIADLEKKMVFLVGPRQVGKTWLAREIGKRFRQTTYLNYDNVDDRTVIVQMSWLPQTELLILDELHKMPQWKNFLKGLYDTRPSHMRILVTGSARLETFRQSGDSLAGRFFLHHLLPFSLVEIKNTQHDGSINRLIERGGFPEPFLTNDKVDADRWRAQYADGLIRTDVLDFENIHDIHAISTIFELLRRRTASPISYSSLARDANISHGTVKKYVDILESLYIIFRISPYSRDIARSLRKEPKVYFFDTGLVIGDDGVQFENFIAISLLKHIMGRNDMFGEHLRLGYLRTKDKKEVDFCIINDEENSIVECIEAKNSDGAISKQLLYFAQKYHFSSVQVVKNLKNERLIQDGITVREAVKYLYELYA